LQLVQQNLVQRGSTAVRPLGVSDIARNQPVTETKTDTKQTTQPQKTDNWMQSVREVSLKPKPSFFTPSKLSKELAAEYKSKLSNLISKRGALLAKIDEPELKVEVARQTLPLACLLAGSNPSEVTKLLGLQSDPAQNLVKKFIGLSYQADTDLVKLVEFYPKTELKIIADLIYSRTDASLQNISALVAEIPRRERTELLLASPPRSIHTSYTFEVLADLQTLAELSKIEPAVELQLISPRFGFDTPEGLKSGVLSDAFESIFDLSLNLYSDFQGSSNNNLAQLLVLSGAKQRAKLTLSFAKLLEVLDSSHAPVVRLGEAMKQLVFEEQPILSQFFDKKVSKTW
jgi:hypothetical protein